MQEIHHRHGARSRQSRSSSPLRLLGSSKKYRFLGPMNWLVKRRHSEGPKTKDEERLHERWALPWPPGFPPPVNRAIPIRRLRRARSPAYKHPRSSRSNPELIYRQSRPQCRPPASTNVGGYPSIPKPQEYHASLRNQVSRKLRQLAPQTTQSHKRQDSHQYSGPAASPVQINERFTDSSRPTENIMGQAPEPLVIGSRSMQNDGLYTAALARPGSRAAHPQFIEIPNPDPFLSPPPSPSPSTARVPRSRSLQRSIGLWRWIHPRPAASWELQVIIAYWRTHYGPRAPESSLCSWESPHLMMQEREAEDEAAGRDQQHHRAATPAKRTAIRTPATSPADVTGLGIEGLGDRSAPKGKAAIDAATRNDLDRDTVRAAVNKVKAFLDALEDDDQVAEEAARPPKPTRRRQPTPGPHVPRRSRSPARHLDAEAPAESAPYVYRPPTPLGASHTVRPTPRRRVLFEIGGDSEDEWDDVDIHAEGESKDDCSEADDEDKGDDEDAIEGRNSEDEGDDAIESTILAAGARGQQLEDWLRWIVGIERGDLDQREDGTEEWRSGNNPAEVDEEGQPREERRGRPRTRWCDRQS